MNHWRGDGGAFFSLLYPSTYDRFFPAFQCVFFAAGGCAVESDAFAL